MTIGVTVTVTRAANTPATGQPTISETAYVGQTLTANTSGISDADGLTNVSYGYQWLADDVEIDGRRVPPTRSSHPTTARSSRYVSPSPTTRAMKRR